MEQKREAYEIVQKNRAWLNRKVSMSFDDLIDVSKLWPVDFFIVNTSKGEKVASAIFYRGEYYPGNMVGA